MASNRPRRNFIPPDRKDVPLSFGAAYLTKPQQKACIELALARYHDSFATLFREILREACERSNIYFPRTDQQDLSADQRRDDR